MPTVTPKVTIDRFEPEVVVAPLLVRTPFKIIGTGLSNEIYVYISTQPNGSDDISNPTASAKEEDHKIKISKDPSASSTDKVLSLIVKPELDAGPFTEETVFFIAVKLGDVKGSFQDALKPFKLV
ncbi:hypothetical protein ATY76_23365 [Rhizobium sp. R339]|uniref:hypothetical protein n=1 Tax=Rhizobium sp. R339 TaxID=1764273 RepID=UPI000B529C82|nr:hypothetical protein [Rhizobium sp. R339]OWV75708.1 hypothetical protein ATY76_23365 [Rhizobium sp. R339]